MYFSFFGKVKFYSVGSEFLTAVVMESSIFWDITPCRISQAASRKSSVSYLLYVGFLLGLFFDSENGGEMFL
jgi:hypothetical protein